MSLPKRNISRKDSQWNKNWLLGKEKVLGAVVSKDYTDCLLEYITTHRNLLPWKTCNYFLLLTPKAEFTLFIEKCLYISQ